MLIIDSTPDTRCREIAGAGRWHLRRLVAHRVVTTTGRLVARDTHQILLARYSPQRLRAPRRGKTDRDGQRRLVCTRLRHVESGTFEPVGAAH